MTLTFINNNMPERTVAPLYILVQSPLLLAFIHAFFIQCKPMMVKKASSDLSPLM